MVRGPQPPWIQMLFPVSQNLQPIAYTQSIITCPWLFTLFRSPLAPAFHFPVASDLDEWYGYKLLRTVVACVQTAFYRLDLRREGGSTLRTDNAPDLRRSDSVPDVPLRRRGLSSGNWNLDRDAKRFDCVRWRTSYDKMKDGSVQLTFASVLCWQQKASSKLYILSPQADRLKVCASIRIASLVAIRSLIFCRPTTSVNSSPRRFLRAMIRPPQTMTTAALIQWHINKAKIA